MLTVAPLQKVLDFICESKMMCPNNKQTFSIEDLYVAIARMQTLIQLIQEYDTEVVITLSTLDTMTTATIPDGYVYVAVTPVEQLRQSMKRCACLLHTLETKSGSHPVNDVWITCLKNIIAYKSSWFKLFEILSHSQPELHRMVAVFSQVRESLALTSKYARDIRILHENLYYKCICERLPLPYEITIDIFSYIFPNDIEVIKDH